MKMYHIALFLHLVTLMAAAGATATTKLAVGRRIRARTVGEALDWHNALMSASKVFPVCLAAFTITGFYMLSVTHTAAWSSGFIVAGLVGVALLFASGTFLGIKARALKQVLETMAKDGPDRPAPRFAPPPLVAVLPLVNTGIALSIVFDMAAKPASVATALAVIAIGVAASVGIATRRRPAARVQEAQVARA